MAKPAAAARAVEVAQAGAGPPPRKVSVRKGPLAELRASDPVLARIIDERAAERTREGRPDPERPLRRARALDRRPAALGARGARDLRPPDRALRRRPPTPQEILADEPEELRAAAGLSRAKVGFLRSLAEHVLSGELELERLEELSDEEVIAELVAVKGLGEWTAHMFLMFHLERPDVLAVGDLGIRRAIERAYGLDALPQAAAIEQIAEPWRPYRTLACRRYLWRSLQNEPG